MYVLQHTARVLMRDLHGITRPLFQHMTLMNGLACSTGLPGQLMNTYRNTRDVSDVHYV